MTTLQAISLAWKVAHEVPAAVQAAQLRLEQGKGPIAALRAFSAATGTRLDDEAVDRLEEAIRGMLTASAIAVEGAAFVTIHREAILATLAWLVGAVTEAGYRAGAARMQLEAWLAEDEGDPMAP